MGSRDISAAELASIVSRRVKLRSRGREWVGLCPFHVEKTPSFYVFKAKEGHGIFYCQGCHAWGSATDWLMRIEGKSYREAIGERDDPEVIAALEGQRRYEERRQTILSAYRNGNPDSSIPDWAIRTD